MRDFFNRRRFIFPSIIRKGPFCIGRVTFEKNSMKKSESICLEGRDEIDFLERERNNRKRTERLRNLVFFSDQWREDECSLFYACVLFYVL